MNRKRRRLSPNSVLLGGKARYRSDYFLNWLAIIAFLVLAFTWVFL